MRHRLLRLSKITYSTSISRYRKYGLLLIAMGVERGETQHLKKNAFVVAQFCGVLAQMRRALLRLLYSIGAISESRRMTRDFKIVTYQKKGNF